MFELQRIAAEIKAFSPDGLVAPKLSKRLDKFTLYILAVGKKALAHGGLTASQMEEIDKSRCGVLIGSGLGGMKVLFHTMKPEPRKWKLKFSNFILLFCLYFRFSVIL